MFNINEPFLKLADVTNKFFVCVDMEGNYCYTNKAYNARFGFERAAQIGQHSLTDIHVDDHQLAIETVGKCCAQPNTACDVILRKPARGGGYVYTQWDFIAIPDEQNNPDYIMCIGMEITSFIEDDEANTLRLDQIAHDQSHMVRRPLANILGLAQLLSETTIESEAERKELIGHLYTVAQELDEVLTSVVSKARSK